MNIPIKNFLLFKNKCNKEILLFNKIISSPKVNLKKLNLKNENNLSLILNKITLQNYQDKAKIFLEKEFLGSNEALDSFTRQIYFKMLSDEHFQYSYLKFYQIIISAYNHYGIKYDYSYLVNLIETKYLMDIFNKDTLLGKIINKEIPNDKKYSYHNLVLIISMIKENILSEELFQNILNQFVNNQDYPEEILVILKNYPEKQSEIISKLNFENYGLRYQVIFKEMLENKVEDIKIVDKIKKKTNEKENLFRNIIEEYLFNEEFEEILVFVKNNLNSNMDNNKFVEIAIEIYLENENKNVINMLMQLYQKNIIKKFNIIEGTITSIEKNKCGKLTNLIANIKSSYQNNKIKINL